MIYRIKGLIRSGCDVVGVIIWCRCQNQDKALKEKIDVLPQLLLHKAFKGELVEQLPTDGDAAELLKEIMALKKK